MSWSKLHGGAHRHRKVLQLESRLGCSELEARGIVLTVWSWTIESEPDGDLDGWTDDALARVWGWRGDAAGFIAALVSVGLLDREDGALRVHDWMEHAEGWKDADRKRKERQKKRRAPRPENVQDASGTVQGLSGKRPPERRGEERRSEERRGEEIKTPPLPPASGAPPAAPAERANPDDVGSLWNDVCGQVLPSISKLTDKRRTKVRSRCSEPGRDLAWWRGYFQRIADSPFLRGEVKSWCADFDWAVKDETTIAKVLEGAYDQRANNHFMGDRHENAAQFAWRMAQEERARESAQSEAPASGQLRLTPGAQRYTARSPPEALTADLFGEHEEAQA